MGLSVEVPRLDLAAVAVNQLVLLEEVAEQVLLGLDVLGDLLGDDLSTGYGGFGHDIAPFTTANVLFL